MCLWVCKALLVVYGYGIPCNEFVALWPQLQMADGYCARDRVQQILNTNLPLSCTVLTVAWCWIPSGEAHTGNFAE